MTFCCLLRGKQPTCLPVKSNFAKDVVFKKEISISCTEKYMSDPVYVFGGVVDSHKTEKIQIQLKQCMGTKQVDIFALS